MRVHRTFARPQVQGAHDCLVRRQPSRRRGFRCDDPGGGGCHERIVEVPSQAVQPARQRHAVRIEKSHVRRRSRAEPRVAGGGRSPGDIVADDHVAHVLRADPAYGVGVAGSVVHHDDRDRPGGSAYGAEQPVQSLGTVADRHHDGDVVVRGQRGRAGVGHAGIEQPAGKCGGRAVTDPERRGGGEQIRGDGGKPEQAERDAAEKHPSVVAPPHPGVDLDAESGRQPDAGRGNAYGRRCGSIPASHAVKPPSACNTLPVTAPDSAEHSQPTAAAIWSGSSSRSVR